MRKILTLLIAGSVPVWVIAQRTIIAPAPLKLEAAQTPGKVIVVSFDGLRPDALTTLGAEVLPNFYRLRTEGAFTDNARSDNDFTTTLPNHTGMILGRPVLGDTGHGLEVNFGGKNTRLHQNGYLASMFDVAHDHGLSTALYATKSKFEAFSVNYDENLGAPDLVGVDNGRDKLDFFFNALFDSRLIEVVSEVFPQRGWDLSMLHFRTLDSTGHSHKWNLDPESAYMMEVIKMDDYLGELFEMIETSPAYAERTHLIVTSDHGGTLGTNNHINESLVGNYIVPFYVWGPGVEPGADLYELNPDFHDPGQSRPRHDSPHPPIRNSMVGNLALQLLGLPAIPGSQWNSAQSLKVTPFAGFEDLHPDLEPDADSNGDRYTNFHHYALGGDPNGPERLDLAPRMDGRNLLVHRRLNAPDVDMILEVSLDGKDLWLPLWENLTYVVESSVETPDGQWLRIKIPFVSEKMLVRQRFGRKAADR